MNGPVSMYVAARDRGVGGVVDKQLVVSHVEERRSVSGGEILGGENVTGGTGGDDPAGQEQHMARDARFRQVMGGHGHGASASQLIMDDLVDGLGGDQIDPRQRLIQQQEIVLLSQTLRDEHALALPAGEIL